MNENQNLLLATGLQMLAMLVPLFKRAGRPDLADGVTMILGRADTNYQEVLRVADERIAKE